MISRLTALFQIRPGEGRLVGLLIGLFLLPNMGAAIGSPGVEALFYSRFGVQFLPFMYMAVGAVTIIVSVILTWMMGRVSRKRVYQSLPAILALTLIISRLLVGMDLNWFYPVLWLWTYLLWTLQALFTWGLSGMVCNTRQAKRLFPLFGAGGILGIALGGLLTQPLVAILGTENLLLIWVGMLVLAVGLARSLLSAVEERRRASWRTRPGLLDELRKGYKTVRRSALLRWIALAAALFSVLFFSIAFPFSKAVATQYPNENSLAGFLGVFQGLITTVAFLTSLLLANRFYARFGFVTAILIFPIVYLVGFGTMFVSTAFVALAAFRFVQMVWLQGVADAAYQAIYNIVPEERREQTRTFVNGVPQQVGIVLVGLLLAIGQQTLQPQQLFIIGVGAAIVTAFAIWKAGRAYRSALVDAIRAGRPQMFFSEEEPFGGFRQDAAAIATAIDGISDANPGVRQVSATILGNLAVPAATDALVAALEDPATEVRAALLKALARAKATAALLEVAACLGDPEPAVRLEAANAVAQLASFPKGVRSHLSPLLTDPDPHVRARIAVILLEYGEHKEAGYILHQMSTDNEPEARIAGLEALAAWKDPSGYDIASASLQDTLPSVRRRAIVALARIDLERGQESLIQTLADDAHSVQEAAANLLAEVGAPIIPRIVAALNEPTLEDGALLTLASLPTRRAAGDILTYARQKVDTALRYDEMKRSVASAEPENNSNELLALALGNASHQHAERALLAVGLLDDPEAMAITLSGLKSRNPAQRANALEMLDSLTARDVIEPVAQLWDPEASTTRAGAPPPFAETLLTALRDPDDWLNATALMSSIDVDDPLVRDEISRLAESGSSLIRETAGYVQAGVAMDTLSTIPMMQRILYLQKVPLFAELSPVELKQVAAITGEHLFHDGDYIAREGELGDEMYVIVSGEVDVRVNSERGEEATLAVRQTGEAVGEMSIISHEPRMASLVAVGDVRALCLEKKPFEAMLRERPEVSLAVMRVLISRLQEQSH
jgi:HEAT repeat protein